VHQTPLSQRRSGSSRKRAFAAAVHPESDSVKNSKSTSCIPGIQLTMEERRSNRSFIVSWTVSNVFANI